MQRAAPSWYKRRPLGALALASCAAAGSLYAYNALVPGGRGAASSLNTASFVPYTLTSRDRISETNSILTLRGPVSRREADANARARARATWAHGVHSVEIKQPQLMIARRYTPIPPAALLLAGAADADGDDGDDGALRLLVRREPQGEVSRYLHALPVGAAVEVRGSFPELGLPEEEAVREVLFLTGGTGIAPALQIAHALGLRGGSARMTVFWANRLRGDCLGGRDAGGRDGGRRGWPSWSGRAGGRDGAASTAAPAGPENAVVAHLDALVAAGAAGGEAGPSSRLRFMARYFVDEEGSRIRADDLDVALRWHRAAARAEAGQGRKLIIVSGPDGFIDYLAGPKRLVRGVETQGPLGGLLAKADLDGWEVWKL